MPANDRERDLHALRNMIDEAHTLLSTIDLPEARARRATTILSTALALTDDLIANLPASSIAHLGGKKTAERGSEYFRKIAAARKTRSGGRPKSAP